jgi:hypothetical protein
MTLREIIKKLETDTPIQDFKFGHTPLQIEFFQTSNQHGDEKWEYWQHILQLKTLHSTLKELEVSRDEFLGELEDANAVWPLWSRKKRLRKVPRIKLQLSNIEKSIAEKTREVNFHLEIIERKYKHLSTLTEDEIVKDDAAYWTRRLGRQLSASHLSRVLGISDGELLAVLALPLEQQQQIFSSMKQLLNKTTALLPKG